MISLIADFISDIIVDVIIKVMEDLFLKIFVFILIIAIIVFLINCIVKNLNNKKQPKMLNNNMYVNNQNYQNYLQNPVQSNSNYQIKDNIQISDNKITLFGNKGFYAGQKIEFFDSIIIGRDPSKANLIFEQNTRCISSIHCRVFKENSRLYVLDLSSSYGTYINERRLKPQIKTNVKSGDMIYLGSTENSFTVL